ncbi:MAG: adenosylcobinamide-phosphate synthase CbiB [Acidobacteriota bacterium]
MAAASVLLVAVMLDAILGDPNYRLHPVRLLGHLAEALERLLRPTAAQHETSRRSALLVAGAALAVLHPMVAVAVYLAFRFAIALLHPLAVYGWDAFVFLSCFAFQDLFRHVLPVAQALERDDLPAARGAVQRIVGRDAELLSSAGVARAAVESVAESLGDGALGPLFWFLAGGAAGALGGLETWTSLALATGAALIYRSINTLDSMVGYRDECYLYFGRASARLDDLLNLLPARLSVLFLSLAALLLRLDLRQGVATWRRDRNRHPSPNAGQSESFVAGALGVRLGGPTTYPYGTVDKAWFGRGREAVTAIDIRWGCRLVALAGWLAVGTTAVTLLLVA